MTGLFLKATASAKVAMNQASAGRRIYQSPVKLNEAMKILDEVKDRPLDYQGLIWETILVAFEELNDAQMLKDFKLLCPDPEGL